MVIPVFSTEQKNTLMAAQLALLTAKIALMEAHRVFEERNASLSKTVNVVIQELGINPADWTVDLDKLGLVYDGK